MQVLLRTLRLARQIFRDLNKGRLDLIPMTGPESRVKRFGRPKTIQGQASFQKSRLRQRLGYRQNIADFRGLIANQIAVTSLACPDT